MIDGENNSARHTYIDKYFYLDTRTTKLIDSASPKLVRPIQLALQHTHGVSSRIESLQCSLLNSNGARLSAAVRYRGQGDTDRSIVSNYFYFNQRLEKFRLNETRRNLGPVPITVQLLYFALFFYDLHCP
jgi:hypothetical protein